MMLEIGICAINCINMEYGVTKSVDHWTYFEQTCGPLPIYSYFQ